MKLYIMCQNTFTYLREKYNITRNYDSAIYIYKTYQYYLL